MALVLGVAFGPRATEVEVRDADSGALVSRGHARHADLGPGVDVDDPTAWWRSLVAAVAQAGEREVAAISVCGSHPGLVLLDGAGAVLRPLQPWAEADGERDAARLRNHLGAERWARTAGFLPSASTPVAHLAWLHRTDPAALARVGAVLLPHEWLTYRLTGRRVTDRGTASLTGAWSPASEAWIPEVLADLEGPPGSWEHRLPDVLGPAEQADWLTAAVYDLLGLRGRPVVGPGTGEPMAVALALGLGPGDGAVWLRDTTAVLIGLDHPVADPRGLVRSHADATGHHLAMVDATGGVPTVAAIADVLDVEQEELGRLALERPPREDDPVLVPAVPGRTGAVLTGLGPGVDRLSLARAAFDGLAAAALDAIDELGEAGATIADGPLRLTGAAAAALDVHAQILATLGDRDVMVAPGGSLAAAGACVQAAAVLTEVAPLEVAEAWDLGHGPTAAPADEPGRLARRLAHAEERARQRRALIERP